MLHFLSIWLVTTLFTSCLAGCSHKYGAEPCTYLPAPPGKTPHCARPGFTYCEHPDHYPGELINWLVHKWRYDHETVFSDETKHDFGAYVYPPPPPKPVYGPPPKPIYGPPPHNNIHQEKSFYHEPIFLQKPQYSFQDPSNYMFNLKPAQNFSLGFNSFYSTPSKTFYEQPPIDRGSSPGFFNYKYTTNIPQQAPPRPYQGVSYLPPNYYPDLATPNIGHFRNEIYKRKVEHHYERLKRSLRYQRSKRQLVRMIEDHSIKNGSDINGLKKKRQADITGEPLCRVRSQFIMPRAALNKEGNWMYVVNMPEVDNRLTQLVKSEVCTSQTCSGLCSLPQGYTSRCEQKYVQKRLVALKGAGNELYTDVFWFPSCCVCTLSNT